MGAVFVRVPHTAAIWSWSSLHYCTHRLTLIPLSDWEKQDKQWIFNLRRPISYAAVLEVTLEESYDWCLLASCWGGMMSSSAVYGLLMFCRVQGKSINWLKNKVKRNCSTTIHSHRAVDLLNGYIRSLARQMLNNVGLLIWLLLLYFSNTSRVSLLYVNTHCRLELKVKNLSSVIETGID